MHGRPVSRSIQHSMAYREELRVCACVASNRRTLEAHHTGGLAAEILSDHTLYEQEAMFYMYVCEGNQRLVGLVVCARGLSFFTLQYLSCATEVNNI